MEMYKQCLNGGLAEEFLYHYGCSLERDFPSRTDPSYVDAFCTLWNVKQALLDGLPTQSPILIVKLPDIEE